MANTTVARLEQEELRKHRASKMIDLRITNHGLETIAAKFNVSTMTVQREIAWYIKNGFLADLESEMISLTGEALRVYKAKLKLNDLDAAKHILDITIKLGDRFQKQGHQEAELGLRAYMAAKREKKDDETREPKDVEGVVVSVDQPQHAGTSTEVAPEVVEHSQPPALATPARVAPRKPFERRVRTIEANNGAGDGLGNPASASDPLAAVEEDTENEE